MNLTEFRAQYPEYNDLDDTQLADSLHSRFYADVPREQFDAAVGYRAPVGVLEAGARGVAQGYSDTGRVAALAGSGGAMLMDRVAQAIEPGIMRDVWGDAPGPEPATVKPSLNDRVGIHDPGDLYDKAVGGLSDVMLGVHNFLTGEGGGYDAARSQKVAEKAFETVVDPVTDQSRDLALDPATEDVSTAAWGANLAGYLTSLLQQAVATGAGGGPATVATGVRNLVQGMKAAQGFAVPMAGTRAQDLAEAGVDPETLAKATASNYGIHTLEGAVPVSIPGNLITRALSGAGANVALGAGQRAAEGEILGPEHDSLAEAPLDPTTSTVEGGLGALMAALFGGKGGAAAGASRGTPAPEAPTPAQPAPAAPAVNAPPDPVNAPPAPVNAPAGPVNAPPAPLADIVRQVAAQDAAARAVEPPPPAPVPRETEAPPPAVPEAPVAPPPAPRGAQGAEAVVHTPRGDAHPVRYEVVDAADLVTSHTADGQVNPAYPPELQPRDRTREASQLQIQKIAGNLKPELLGESATAGEGAPIIGADRVVESGNGRVEALRRAYRGEGGERYRAWLDENAERFGVDREQLAGLREPVLVRTRQSAEGRAEFARDANQANVAGMAPAEQARADAAAISDELLELYRPDAAGNPLAASNEEFLRAFAGTIGDTAAGALRTGDGRWTKQMADRVQAAVFERAYGNPRLLEAMAEEADPEFRNILGALQVAAPAFARARAIGAESQVVDAIGEALELVRTARHNGQAVEEVLAQADAFNAPSEAAQTFAAFFAANIRSGKRIAEALRTTGEVLEAEARRGQNGALFDDPGATPDQIARAGTRGADDGQAQGRPDQPDGAPGARGPEPELPATGTDGRYRGWQPPVGRRTGADAADDAGRDPVWRPPSDDARDPAPAGREDPRHPRVADGGIPREQAAAVVRGALEAWPNAPGVRVVQSVDELGNPNAPSDARGHWRAGQVTLVADNLSDDGAVFATLLHEVVGHDGVSRVLGDRFEPTMEEVYRALASGKFDGQGMTLDQLAWHLREEADGPPLDLSVHENRMLAAEEYLAYLAERGAKSDLLDKVITRVYQAIRRIFPQVKMTKAEVRALLASSRRLVEGTRSDLERGPGTGLTPGGLEPGAVRAARQGPDDAPLLRSYDEAELRDRDAAIEETRAREEAADTAAREKAEADRQVDDFELTGSDRPADANPRQRSLFARRGPPDESEIVNPITRDATPEQKVRELVALSRENEPIVKRLIERVDERFGTDSKLSHKKPENILSKSQRPSVLAKKPWFGVEHVRDGLRFKTVLSDVADLSEVLRMAADEGLDVIKADVEKVLEPQEWGWRIAAFDMRFPNGQIVEWYLPVRELEAAKKAGNHQLFEKWRNRDLSRLTPDEIRAYQHDLDESYGRYHRGWKAYLTRTGQDESAVRAAVESAAQAAEDLSAARASDRSEVVSSADARKKFSMRSSAENSIRGDQDPSMRDAANPSSRTSARPSSRSTDAMGLDTAESPESSVDSVSQPGVTPKGTLDRERFARDAAAEPPDETTRRSAESLGVLSAAGQRWSAAADRLVWQPAARRVRAILGHRMLRLADTSPPAVRQMLREYRAEVLKAGRRAETIADAGKELPEPERRLISDYIEGEIAAGDTPPEHVVEIATQMQAALRDQGDELVRLGMLDPESRARLGDRYLARYYAKHLLDNPLDRTLRQLHRRSIEGSRLKGRGLFKTITAGEWEKFERLGWELRDSRINDSIEGVPRFEKVRIWRDYTPTERRRMGEIRDGVYRYVRGYLEAQKDVAMGRLFETIAKSEHARRVQPDEDWIQVPDTTIADTGGVKRYGALSGMWVPRDVWDHLRSMRAPDPEGFGTQLYSVYARGLNLWKSGKTAMNPVVHSNNIVSNVVMADLAGIHPLNLKQYRAAFKEYRGRGPRYQEALDAGLFGTEFYGAEIGQMVPALDAFKDVETAAAGWASKALDFSMKYTGTRLYAKKMGEWYQAEDQFFKLMVFMKERDRGASVQEAVDTAERFFFNYADIPQGVRVAKAVALPFLSYSYKAAPALLHAAVHTPWRFAKWLILFGGANWAAYESLFGPQGDEREAVERELLPDYLKGDTALSVPGAGGVPKAMRLPWQGANGEAEFLDLSRRMPLGDLFDMHNQAGGVGLPAPIMPGNPVLTLFGGLVWNVDAFRGRAVVDEVETRPVQERAAWALRQILPNTPVLPGSYSWNKVMNGIAGTTGKTLDFGLAEYTGKDYYGREQDLPRALADTVAGFKIRSIDMDQAYQRKMREVRHQVGELQARVRSVSRDKRLSEETRKARLDELREQMFKRQDEAAELPNPTPGGSR